MDNRLNKLTILLAKQLQNTTRQFLIQTMEEEEELSFLNSMVMSAYISALHNSLIDTCCKDQDHIKRVKNFINDLLNSIHDFSNIESVRKLPKEEYPNEH